MGNVNYYDLKKKNLGENKILMVVTLDDNSGQLVLSPLLLDDQIFCNEHALLLL